MLSRRNPTIYRIRTPQFGVGAALGVVRSVGFFATWTIAVTILILVAGTISSLPSRYGPFILIGVLGISFLVAYLWVRAFNWWHTQRVVNRFTARTSRLVQFLATEEARNRFPHRVVELTCHNPRSKRKDFERVMQSFPAATILIDNEPRQSELPPPCPIRVGFEPISLEQDSIDAAELLRSGLEDLGHEVELEYEEDTKTTFRIAFQRVKASDLYQWAMGLGPILLLALWALYRGNFFIAVFICGILLLFVLIGVQAFGSERWWLVPGGLALSSHGLLGRKAMVRLFSRESGPIYLDMASFTGCVFENGALRSFRFAHFSGWVLTSTWLGTATRPSLEAIESCLNTRKQEPLAF